MTDQLPYRIIQIIPANGWGAVYDYDGKEATDPLICWALVERKGPQGFREAEEVVGMDIDSRGLIMPCEEIRNFVRYRARP